MALRTTLSRLTPPLRPAISRPYVRNLPAYCRSLSATPIRRFPSEDKPAAAKQSGPSVTALLAVASLGFASYYVLVQNRKGQGMLGSCGTVQARRAQPSLLGSDNTTIRSSTENVQPKSDAKKIPAFDPKDVTVIFVLGGPGAGKGTQSEYLQRDYGFVHLSAGDLLRDEQKRQGSKYGELIKNYIKEGLIVPHEVTIALLENAMREAIQQGKTRFLIDGFPRKMDQAIEFERVVVPSRCVLYFECPEEEMLKRLLKRGETSGRADDNIESIRKRFKTFEETSYPVIAAYAKEGKVYTISCANKPDVVYGEVKKIINNLFKENV
ncbi:UMP-CMP kinase [Endogone sp. FLAS-F59071]|nr:UMP-CMP kinase [Endogone sp. FLAS-F59071]|eukprot:RUS16106.1 UMP-CMP kinase [Endogone sp. FLAS-F59071]